MEDRSLLAGIDLCEDFTQLCCYSDKRREPESIGFMSAQEQYLIPTCLGVLADTKEWTFGEEAVRLTAQKQAVLVTNLLKKAVDPEQTELLGKSFSGVFLLEKFLRKVLTMLKAVYPDKMLLKLTVTLEKPDYRLAGVLYKALEPLGLREDRVQVQGHTASFLYYTIHQSRELWMNDVGLFHIAGDGMRYYRLNINRKVVPMVASVTEKDMHDTFPAELPGEEPETAAALFEQLAQITLHKQILSSIFATGRGFEGGWADDVLMKLCSGRKVFMGQNLYAKGACYASKASAEGKDGEFIFLDDDMIPAEIAVMAWRDGKNQRLTLVRAGSVWYNTDTSMDLLLEGEYEIPLIVTDFITKKAETHLLSLTEFYKEQTADVEGAGQTGEKSSVPDGEYPVRVRVRVRFTEAHCCVVTVKDMGFGDYQKSTDRIWENQIRLE